MVLKFAQSSSTSIMSSLELFMTSSTIKHMKHDSLTQKTRVETCVTYFWMLCKWMEGKLDCLASRRLLKVSNVKIFWPVLEKSKSGGFWSCGNRLGWSINFYVVKVCLSFSKAQVKCPFEKFQVDNLLILRNNAHEASNINTLHKLF